MDLNTAASIAEVIGALLVVGGFAFAVMQLNAFKLQRRTQATIEVARSFQTPEFAKALELVLSLPDNATAQDVQNGGKEMESAAVLVSFTIEAVGLMVHRRMVSMELVWELMGGLINQTWQRLEPWTEESRERWGTPKFNEWTQWLAEQLIRHVGTFRKRPAYIRHADWARKGTSDI